MSDIRKDFESHKLWMYHPSFATIGEGDYWFYVDDVVQHRWEGYRAGRAHNIEGLIAEIEAEKAAILSYPSPVMKAGKRCAIIALDGCISIIRKHFGKE